MSLQLEDGTIPSGLSVKTSEPPMLGCLDVLIGDITVGMRVLLQEAWKHFIPGTYTEDHPFLRFVLAAQMLQQVPGWSAEMAMGMSEADSSCIIGRERKRFALPDNEDLAARFPSMTDFTPGLGPQHIKIGSYHISYCDYVEMIWYVLTNTDLQLRRDPRLKFVSRLQGVHVEDFGEISNLVTGSIHHHFRLTAARVTH